MPSITRQISSQGPLIDVLVVPSEPRLKALQAANKSIPLPQIVRALIDTGASSSCVDPSILSALGLTPTGTISVLTPSTGSVPYQCDQYDVGLIIAHNSSRKLINSLAVMESNLSVQGIQALIGRDVLKQCLLIYNGEADTYTLAF